MGNYLGLETRTVLNLANQNNELWGRSFIKLDFHYNLHVRLPWSSFVVDFDQERENDKETLNLTSSAFAWKIRGAVLFFFSIRSLWVGVWCDSLVSFCVIFAQFSQQWSDYVELGVRKYYCFRTPQVGFLLLFPPPGRYFEAISRNEWCLVVIYKWRSWCLLGVVI